MSRRAPHPSSSVAHLPPSSSIRVLPARHRSPPTVEPAPRPAEDRRSAGRDRWLIRAVAVVAALVVAAAVALLVSLIASPTPPSPTRRSLDPHHHRAIPPAVDQPPPERRANGFDLDQLDVTTHIDVDHPSARRSGRPAGHLLA